MFNIFKKSPRSNDIQMNVSGVNPETDNEFMFYEFICKTPNYILEPWIKKAREVGYKIRPAYEKPFNKN